MEQIKTLLERAKPELLVALEKSSVELPNMVKHVKDFLSSNYFCNDITWGIWIDLRTFFASETHIVLDSPWEMFEDIK